MAHHVQIAFLRQVSNGWSMTKGPRPSGSSFTAPVRRMTISFDGLAGILVQKNKICACLARGYTARAQKTTGIMKGTGGNGSRGRRSRTHPNRRWSDTGFGSAQIRSPIEISSVARPPRRPIWHADASHRRVSFVSLPLTPPPPDAYPFLFLY